jgi:3-isopropylmalate/(R)-2-methylmalate dehydratase small subunit
MKTFGGRVLFLDRSDINTDEIIPARYLTELSKKALAPHLLEDLSLASFERERDLMGKGVVVTRANFGCGSSREHAPWALEANGIHVVIAESFARIFRQNMYNCGMLAIELSKEDIARVFTVFAQARAKPAANEATARETECAVNVNPGRLTFMAGQDTLTLPFTLHGFDRELIQAGGWLAYADKRYP